jgi:hypothetical protein
VLTPQSESTEATIRFLLRYLSPRSGIQLLPQVSSVLVKYDGMLHGLTAPELASRQTLQRHQIRRP